MSTNEGEVQEVLAAVTEWAKVRSFRGLALVGSYARGQARPDSDIDLVLLTDDPDVFRVDAASWQRLPGVAPVFAPQHTRMRSTAPFGPVMSNSITVWKLNLALPRCHGPMPRLLMLEHSAS